MQRISVTVDVLLKFFEELESMQNALSKSFSFIGNNVPIIFNSSYFQGIP